MDNNSYKSSSSSFVQMVESRAFEYLETVEPKILRDPFEYILKSGGKRIRPLLVMIACGISGSDPKKAVDMALSMEILHNFTLVHDDIMDGSPIRRGSPTIHIKWGVPIGVLLGDLMIGYACRLMPKHDMVKIFDVQRLFNESIIEVCEGQALDMEFNTMTDISKDDYMKMIHKKTSYLLIASLQIGALIGGGDEKLVTKLGEFGDNFGKGFQLQDDLLDLTAENPKFGKVKGQDLIEGKKTFMIIEAKQKAKSQKDIDLLDKFYRNNGLEENDIPQMIMTMQELGVFESAQKEAYHYFDKASKILDTLPKNDYSQMLGLLFEDMIVRTH